MHNIHRNKITAVWVLCLVLVSTGIKSQTLNLITLDWRKIHFGFTLGTNISDFKYQLSDTFYKMDTFLKVDVRKTPGITLGAISDVHIMEYFDLRFMPSLVIAQRTFSYNYRDGSSVDKSIESIYAEFPVLVKYKSTRHQNVRFYVLGGGKAAYDFSSEASSVRNPNNPIVALKPWNYYYELGCGLDLYFELFKFSPEIKISRGLNNILSPYNDIYSKSFKSILSNFIFISFHFEG